MSKYFFFFIFSTILLLYGCQNKNAEIEKKMLQMKSERVNLRLDSLVVVRSEKKVNARPYKLVRFLNVDLCVPCIVHKLKSMIYDDVQDRVSNCVVLNISPVDYKMLMHRMKTLDNCPSNLFIDTLDVFRMSNPHIPDEEMFHTFLLDERDSVVLVGDPTKNQKIEELLIKTIESPN